MGSLLTTAALKGTETILHRHICTENIGTKSEKRAVKRCDISERQRVADS